MQQHVSFLINDLADETGLVLLFRVSVTKFLSKSQKIFK